MTLRLQAVRVRTGSDDEDGRLVLADDALVGILVRLSPDHGETAGRWFLEAGFGELRHPVPAAFEDLAAALAWIADRLRAPN
ncbi:hypothetical protein [Methylobacterium sp. J-068]|uniref:hypothetical protein n=1 Tax=Methylobacterium sp. J-068 TaxID=2836649 RepID=UPI001FBA70A0|nr:hypothetical protein [Methylobacterium sp. J-068]MCJ2036170.1 hypothetical protein [Methylobacterium sp. J-068]